MVTAYDLSAMYYTLLRRVADMTKLFSILLLLFMGVSSSAESIYRSVDSEGNVTYSNQPVTDAVDSDRVGIPPGPAPELKEQAQEELKALVERTDELVDRRLQRNLELTKEKLRLQQAAQERRAREALLNREFEWRRGYPIYPWPRYRHGFPTRSRPPVGYPPSYRPRPPVYFNSGRSRLNWPGVVEP